LTNAGKELSRASAKAFQAKTGAKNISSSQITAIKSSNQDKSSTKGRQKK
jgi:hypothetical protein